MLAYSPKVCGLGASYNQVLSGVVDLLRTPLTANNDEILAKVSVTFITQA